MATAHAHMDMTSQVHPVGVCEQLLNSPLSMLHSHDLTFCWHQASSNVTNGLACMCSGGYSAGFNDTLASMEIWDPNTQTWTNGTDLPTPRGDLMCDTLAGQYVAAGGFWDPTNEFNPDSFRTEVQMYNPKTG